MQRAISFLHNSNAPSSVEAGLIQVEAFGPTSTTREVQITGVIASCYLHLSFERLALHWSHMFPDLGFVLLDW